LWGTGQPTREFLYVDDAAAGIVLALERLDDTEPVNLGSATEISIRDLAERIAQVTGFKGRFVWDPSKPDGQPRRAVDGAKAQKLLGWSPHVTLEDGLERTVQWFREPRE